ncbi:translocation/assembly module TamB domain-containing protein [Telmatospirillum sp. J64-1]|uniref:translocation/assembly module TamB domain-containing protein n=1 Tax=Telmatospirillum sp. J64-1 TaxID=2502183 RepID=UPI00115E53E1|nr:translocation/assembly module TamB domain-containing protein [Telmatospirillum sp. J64-1]
MAVRIAVGIVVALVVLIAGATAFIHSETGGKWLTARIASALAGEDGDAEVEGFSLSWPFQARIDRLSMADREGVWLDARGLALVWSPSALLRRDLIVDNLEAKSIRISRLPETEERPQEEREGLPRLPDLPVDVDVRRIQAVIHLDEGVAGEAAALALDGNLRLANGAASTDLDLRRIDGRPARAGLVLDYDETRNHLGVDMRMDRHAGALLMAVAGLEDMPEPAVTLRGEGPLSDWQGRLDMVAAQRQCLGADIGLALGDALGVRADGLLDLSCVGQDYRALAPEGVTFALDASLNEGDWLIRDLRVAGEALSAQASGHLRDEEMTLDLSARVPELAALAGLAGVEMMGPLSFAGHLGGTPAEPNLEGRLEAGEGGAAALRWRSIESNFAVAVAEWISLRMDAAIHGPATVEGELGPLGDRLDLRTVGRLSPETGRVEIEEVSAQAAALALAASGVLEDWGLKTQIDLRAEGDAALLTSAAAEGEAPAEGEAAAGEGLRGLLKLTGQVTGNLHGPDLVAAFSGNTENFSIGNAIADQVLGPRPTLEGRVLLPPDGIVMVEQVVLAGEGGRMLVHGQVGEQYDLQIDLEIAEMLPFAVEPMQGGGGGGRVPAIAPGRPLTVDPIQDNGVAPQQPLPETVPLEIGPLQGRITIRTRLMGALDAPRLTGTAEFEGLMNDEPLSAQARFDLPQIGGRVAGRVELAARLRGMTIDGDTQLSFGEGELVLSDLSLRGPGGAAIGGDVRVALEEVLAEGRLTGEIRDMAPWGRLAEMDLSGATSFDLRLVPAPGQAAAIIIEGRDIALGENAVSRLEARVDAGNLSGDSPQATAILRASGVAAGGSTLTSLALDAEGGVESLDYTLSADGQAADHPLSLRSAGVVRLSESLARIASLEMTYADLPLRLVAPTEVAFGDDIRLSPTQLEAGQGRIEIAGSLAGGERLAGNLVLSDVPLSLAEPFVGDLGLAGTLRGQGALSGTLSRPEGSLTLQSDDLALRQLALTGGQARISANLAENALAAEGNVAVPGILSLSFEAGVPVDLDGPEMLPPNGALAGQLNFDGDIGRITDALPLAAHRISGPVQAAFTLGGTVSDPQVGGQAAMSGGRYENYDSGTIIQDIQLTLSARDSQSFALEGQGTDGSGGRMTIGGQVEMEENGLYFRAEGNLNNFQVVRMDEGTAWANGALNFEGRDDQAALTGRIDILRAQVDLDSVRGGAQVVTLDVIEVNRPGGPRVVLAEEGEPGVDFTVALSVELRGQQIFVRGMGADTEWRADLVVGGTASQPELIGEVTAVRGNYDFLGRTFRLSRGLLTFDGGDRINPALDVMAEAEAGDVTAQVLVTGRADQPNVEIASTPAYPSDEVLSRVLFGQEMGALSPMQQLQLGRTAAGLAFGGGGPGFDPVGLLRGALGLDMLEIGGDGEDGPGVTAGRYLGRDIFLRLDQSAAGARAAIEVDLGRGLSLEAEAGQHFADDAAASSGVGLRWRRDY